MAFYVCLNRISVNCLVRSIQHTIIKHIQYALNLGHGFMNSFYNVQGFQFIPRQIPDLYLNSCQKTLLQQPF